MSGSKFRVANIRLILIRFYAVIWKSSRQANNSYLHQKNNIYIHNYHGYYRLSAYWHPFRKIEQGGTFGHTKAANFHSDFDHTSWLEKLEYVSDEWKVQCDHLLKPIAKDRKWRAAMGMPENWVEHPVWR